MHILLQLYFTNCISHYYTRNQTVKEATAAWKLGNHFKNLGNTPKEFNSVVSEETSFSIRRKKSASLVTNTSVSVCRLWGHMWHKMKAEEEDRLIGSFFLFSHISDLKERIFFKETLNSPLSLWDLGHRPLPSTSPSWWIFSVLCPESPCFLKNTTNWIYLF